VEGRILSKFHPWNSIPLHLLTTITDLASPLTLADAKKHRKKAIKERKVQNMQISKEIFERHVILYPDYGAWG
jgi:predicted transcriptional regulator